MKWVRIIESDTEAKFFDLDEVISVTVTPNKLVLDFKAGSDWLAVEVTNQNYMRDLLNYFNDRSITTAQLKDIKDV